MNRGHKARIRNSSGIPGTPGVTQVVPSKRVKWVNHNKKEFAKTLQKLEIILLNEKYVKSIDEGYHGFILSMNSAILTGRRITLKMKNAISGIIDKYKKWDRYNTDVKYRNKLIKRSVDTSYKIGVLKQLMWDCKFAPNTEARYENFLESLRKFSDENKFLTKKQKMSLNQMHRKFKKRMKTKFGIVWEDTPAYERSEFGPNRLRDEGKAWPHKKDKWKKKV
tara:strand:+ start:1505 stop:2170 length:666 start_codon:yes stop_codon:yes gene_type:complete